MNKWVKIITGDDEEFITGRETGINFLEWEIPSVSTTTNDTEIAGTDGSIPGVANFAPFSLSLKFFYEGTDMNDLNLFTQKLKSIVHRRSAYYIIHSEMPCYKYAVNKAEIEWEIVNHGDATFVITFNCYKGYAESLYDTDNFNLSDGLWQFESGVLPDSSISYEHTRQRFDILNGSNDTINPRLRHKLKIHMRLDAPNGFKLINTTTGDIFHYKVALDSNDRLLIDGAYPYLLHDLQDKRCGRNTNHGVITLAPGINKFEIWGNVSNTQTKFTFPFIYR